MMLIRAVVLVLLLTPGLSHAQPSFWRDNAGQPIADSESMKSKGDFGGSLLATTDEDWEKKWNTPPDTRPNFNKAGEVPYGKKVFILTFFANPKLTDDGRANIRCDLRVVAPTGKVSVFERDIECFVGEIKGNPHNTYLSVPVVAFSGDPGDPPGAWVVEVSLRDVTRNVELPLRTSFELK